MLVSAMARAGALEPIRQQHRCSAQHHAWLCAALVVFVLWTSPTLVFTVQPRQQHRRWPSLAVRSSLPLSTASSHAGQPNMQCQHSVPSVRPGAGVAQKCSCMGEGMMQSLLNRMGGHRPFLLASLAVQWSLWLLLACSCGSRHHRIVAGQRSRLWLKTAPAIDLTGVPGLDEPPPSL
jgi:hypothetical protein